MDGEASDEEMQTGKRREGKRKMIRSIQMLIDDHARMRSMLVCFEGQLERFENAEKPDYEILGGSIAYCQEYLDRWHHPHEEMILDLLKRRAPAKARIFVELDDQHRGLARVSEELVTLFDAVEQDAEFPRERLVELGRTLLDDYRHHLEWEETNFFSAAMEHLLPEDWREIAGRFAASTVPPTPSLIDQRYQTLHDAISEAKAVPDATHRQRSGREQIQRH
ncbi:hemerythrin domain-containing protein [Bauldia litoralis]|uniref:hemerythrin domain-containing protein n=1 Tax=Bauldia litoralis TaxID=665467 RepID=UPI003266E5A6